MSEHLASPDDRIRLEVRIEPLGREVLAGVLAGGEERVRADVGLVPVFSDERPLQGLAGFIDWRLSGRLSRLVRAGICSGRDGDALLMPGGLGLPVDRLVFVGIGESEGFTSERAREVALRLVEMAGALCAEGVVLALPSTGRDPGRLEALVDALVTELLRRDRGQGEVSPPERPADAAESAMVEPRSRWWFVAPAEATMRLRSVLSGPPHAAAPRPPGGSR